MMPDYWTSKPLRELVSISKGKKVTISDTYEQNSMPYIGAKAFGGDFAVFTSSKEAIICEQDDVLILWDGERSGLATTGLHGAVSSTVARLRSKGEVNPHFLYYFIDSKFKWIQERRTGLAIPHVPKDLKDLLIIDLPTQTEQKKIAAILSSVDDAIQATQAIIDKTHRVKQGLLQQLLTRGIGHTRFKQTESGEIPEEWLEGTLGNYLKEIKGGGTPSRKNTTYWEGAIPWGSVKDLTGAYLDNTEEYITEEGLKNSASNLIPAGTVIIATRMALGKVIRFSCDVAINQDLKALYPIKELSSDFLFYWLLLQASLIETLGAGSTVKGIRLESLRALKLMLPPIGEQKKIVAILTGVDEVLNTEQDKMLQLNKIKKGLMQDLLTGRFRVKPDEVDTT